MDRLARISAGVGKCDFPSISILGIPGRAKLKLILCQLYMLTRLATSSDLLIIFALVSAVDSNSGA